MTNENISFQTVEYMQQRIGELHTENLQLKMDAASTAADERAKIVAWLRDSHKGRLRSSVLLAQSIEANVHAWNGKGAPFPKREHLK